MLFAEIRINLRFYKLTHLRLSLAYLLIQPVLSQRADIIMFSILNLVIRIPVQVIGQKTHRLHVREKTHGVGQHLDFERRKKRHSRFEIAFCESTEDIHIEMHLRHIRFVFGSRASRGTQEVSEIGKDKRRHHRI